MCSYVSCPEYRSFPVPVSVLPLLPLPGSQHGTSFLPVFQTEQNSRSSFPALSDSALRSHLSTKVSTVPPRAFSSSMTLFWFLLQGSDRHLPIASTAFFSYSYPPFYSLLLILFKLTDRLQKCLQTGIDLSAICFRVICFNHQIRHCN
mgnify:CR=1 FL=1